MYLDPTTIKYLIKARITADGVVEKPDVVGAIFGQTEGLLGEELDLRDLQKSGRIGRIEVNIDSKKGKSEGEITVPSSLDKVETAILASALETIDRVGPCKADIRVEKVEDVRVAKRNKIIERSKKLLIEILKETKLTGETITDVVRNAVHTEEIISYGTDRCPAGPNIDTSDAIIIVEGRSDVLNLLKYGIKNAIAVEGTSIPKTIQDLTKTKNATAFVDGDRGGELILRELFQVAEIDFVARAPKNNEVEELTQKQLMKALRNKIPVSQYMENLPKNEKIGEQPFIPKQEKTIMYPKEEKKHTFHILRPKPAPKKLLSPAQIKYRETLTKLSGLSKARVLDESGNTVSEMNVRDMVNSQIPKNGVALVFDGIITQRMVDRLSDTNIKTVVGVKTGSIVKQPSSLTLLTKEELE